MILLDTSALLYWTIRYSQLPDAAKQAIEAAEDIRISSISFWEIGLKSKKGNLELPLSLRDYTKRIRSAARITILAVDEEIWLKNVELDWHHRDPADRTIVATALLLDCPLITSDLAIRDFYAKAIW